MTTRAAEKSLSLGVIALGIATHPLAIGPSVLNNVESPVSWPLVIGAALPFVASLCVLAITREPRLAVASALGPLVASIGIHLLVVTGTNSYPLATLVLAPFCWINLLLLFPVSFWVGLHWLGKREPLEEPSNTSQLNQ